MSDQAVLDTPELDQLSKLKPAIPVARILYVPSDLIHGHWLVQFANSEETLEIRYSSEFTEKLAPMCNRLKPEIRPL